VIDNDVVLALQTREIDACGYLQDSEENFNELQQYTYKLFQANPSFEEAHLLH
jgi:hypothetical protein